MKSMTGFGRGEVEEKGHLFTIEIKTVNHRYFEGNIHISRKLGAFEAKVRETVKQTVVRGKTDVYVNYTNRKAEEGSVLINEAKLTDYLKKLRETGTANGLEDDLKLSTVLELPGVLETDDLTEEETVLEEILLKALAGALQQLDQMRLKEGAALQQDFGLKLDELEALVTEIEENAGTVVEAYKEKLYTRIQAYLDPEKLPEPDSGRLEMEIALFADRCCIDEELTRLHSHIKQFRQMIVQDGPIGRQLDFLTQELGREANTIASKANHLTITQKAVAMKNVIEKIREQIQNIE